MALPHFLKKLAQWSFVSLLGAIPVLAAENATRPNIIFLLADDMGYGDLGCFGSKIVQSPHLQYLSQSGGPTVPRRPNLENPDLYFGCISMLDHHIGRLMDNLEDKGLAENTLVVFTSDNGPEHRTKTAFGSSGHLKGAKGHMHDGGIHVPGIVRWPGKIEAGSTSDEPVNGTDWLPSFCSVAGINPHSDRPLDGANVLPSLTEGKVVERDKPMLWWLWHARGGFEVAMRQGDYKLLASMDPQLEPGKITDTKQPEGWSIMQFIKQANLTRFEMFNLSKDPSETTDIARFEQQKFNQLKIRLIKLYQEIQTEGPKVDMRPKKN